MTRFGIDKVFYYCPRLNKGVFISLYYGVYRDEKIYSSIDCENKTECKTEERRNWKSCRAYKSYVGERH